MEDAREREEADSPTHNGDNVVPSQRSRYRGRRPQRRAASSRISDPALPPEGPSGEEPDFIEQLVSAREVNDSLSIASIASENPPEENTPRVSEASAPENAASIGGTTASETGKHAASIPVEETREGAVTGAAELSAQARNDSRVESSQGMERIRQRVTRVESSPVMLKARGLSKRYGAVFAANGIDLDVKEGSFYGFVGPNGAGKTTTLSMITGLLKPTSGTVSILEHDMWKDSLEAKRLVGVLPDRLRLFDKLTGAQLLYYAGILHGLDPDRVSERAAELSAALGLENALGRQVSDYSAGMQKKIALASAMIHTPRILVLDEPFESIDPVSAATVTEMLEIFVEGGGSVLLSSHSIDLIQRVCDHVAIIVEGNIVASGTVDAVRDGISLEDRFTRLTGSDETTEGLEWLRGFSG
ncbi:ABC transporter ATP-binding protein [Lysinibacter sp. HNR]|uniref:ABC transporter ATP-binding protein n=1 Tax=Lysinibacter sp. HNR TaxID=3031408 RepID=UPI002435607A|nr:ABC transporter ATP-binding protein [Lysinibacter sp. HNR]WGD38315.1 ABC transporter ATP-binding protein [Lysinibacter sp. HNR]